MTGVTLSCIDKRVIAEVFHSQPPEVQVMDKGKLAQWWIQLSDTNVKVAFVVHYKYGSSLILFGDIVADGLLELLCVKGLMLIFGLLGNGPHRQRYSTLQLCVDAP